MGRSKRRTCVLLIVENINDTKQWVNTNIFNAPDNREVKKNSKFQKKKEKKKFFLLQNSRSICPSRHTYARVEMTTTLTTSPSAEGGGGGRPLRPVETNRIVAHASSSLFEDGGAEGEGGKKREGKTQYEIERDAKVRENEARMRALGIDGLAEKLAMDAAKKKKKSTTTNKRAPPPRDDNATTTTRMTRRQRMISNETVEEKEAREAAERVQREEANVGARNGRGGHGRAKTRGLEFPNVKEEFPLCEGVFGPFTMKTPKTNGPITVLNVGAPVGGGRRRFESEFWSRSGCLYHHPYLIGYKAEKTFQGRVYVMEIVDGEDRPMFRVTDKENPGKTFVGETPTAPWYDLVVSKRLGTRISGPQFFGFSERMTMAAIGFALNGDEEMLKQCYSKGYATDEED